MMAEQRPEQPTPKIDTEGYVDRGAGAFEKTNRPLGRFGSFLRRHPFAQQVAAVGAFVGLGGIAASEVAGCGPATETGKPIITTPNVTMVPTTTETGTTAEKPTTTELSESKLIKASEVAVTDIPKELNKILDIRLGSEINDIKKVTRFEAKAADSDKSVSFYFISTSKKNYIANNVKDWGFRVKDYIVGKNIYSGSKETHIVYRNYDGTEPFLDFILGGDFQAKSGEEISSYSSRVNSLLTSPDAAALISKNITKVSINDTANNIKIEYSENNKPEINSISKAIPIGEEFVRDIDKKLSEKEIPYKSNGEIRSDYLDGLVSTEKTIEDVKKGAVPKGVYMEKPTNVPRELQDLFKKANPDDEILYVGSSNSQDNPEKMRDVATTKHFVYLYKGSKSLDIGSFRNFGGTEITDSKYGKKGKYTMIKMEFLDVVPVVDPDNPNTKDFYIRGMDPINKTDEIYVRVITGKYEYTRLHPEIFGTVELKRGTTFSYFDLSQKIQPIPDQDKNKAENFLQGHKLGELMQRGDVLDILVYAEKFVDEAKNGNGTELDVYTDKNNAHIAQTILVERFKDADELEALFQ